jgi:ribosome biogenesis GTPase
MFDPIDLDALRRIGLNLALLQRLMQQPPHAAQRLMRLCELQRDAMTLHDGSQETMARAMPALVNALLAQGETLAVGDWVLAERNVHGQYWVTARVPPFNRLARRSNDGNGGLKRQVLVSNIDTALLLMGVDHDFNLRRLERYLALVRLAEVQPLLVLTKADTCSEAVANQRLAQAAAILPPGTACFALDARQASACERLEPWLQPSQTLVLLGSSGAGKSTLTNTLAGVEAGQGGQDTGGVRSGDSRGRHTTTSRTLYRTASGACVIDTPGLRALRLDVGSEAEVGAVFDDIQRAAAACRFRDCRHQGEPGCAVQANVSADRLHNFHKLQREARRDQLTPLERQEQKQAWKARGKAGHARLAAKRGE